MINMINEQCPSALTDSTVWSSEAWSTFTSVPVVSVHTCPTVVAAGGHRKVNMFRTRTQTHERPSASEMKEQRGHRGEDSFNSPGMRTAVVSIWKKQQRT